MNFAEEGWNVGDNRRDVKVLCLTKLTFATCSHIPSNISVQVWPPKVEKEVMGCCEDSLMAKRVMCELNQ